MHAHRCGRFDGHVSPLSPEENVWVADYSAIHRMTLHDSEPPGELTNVCPTASHECLVALRLALFRSIPHQRDNGSEAYEDDVQSSA